MTSWYKHHITPWMDGTESLSDGAYRAYHIICQLIYLHEGPIRMHERGIAGRCNQSIRAFKKHFQELVDAGKLTLEDGLISNSRALFELETVRTKREKSRMAGEKSGESRKRKANALKNNEPAPTDVEHPGEQTRLEKTREDSPLPPSPGGGLFEGGLDPPAKPKPDDGFERFYSTYPKRIRRKEAEKSWRSAVKRKPADEIIAAAGRFAADVKAKGTEARYIAAPAVWLNNDRWDDWGPDREATHPAMAEDYTPARPRWEQQPGDLDDDRARAPTASVSG